MKSSIHPLICATWVLALVAPAPAQKPLIQHRPNETIVIVGNGLGSRMMQHGYFETEIFLRNREKDLTIRNLCDEVNTPAFWPHSARPNPWAFPGAEKFVERFDTKERHGTTQIGRGFEKSPDEWLEELKPDTIFAFYGFNESFRGDAGVETYKQELSGYLKHLQSSEFKGKAPRVVLFSPIAFQNISTTHNTPVGTKQNKNLARYTAAMKEVAGELKISFVDLYQPTSEWFKNDEILTVDGASLNEAGYRKLGAWLAKEIYGPAEIAQSEHENFRKLVNDKNWYWHNFYKIPNGVHVYGTRYKPYGPENYPDEQKKLGQMVANRDLAIIAKLRGKDFELKAADTKTHKLPPVKTNFKTSRKNGSQQYLYGAQATQTIKLPEGYKAELFASEKEFPELENPVQMSFDNEGRLWVAVMPTYPHFKPGDARPNDKLLIFEDTDNDGKADKQTVFADGLHLPIGFELAPEGVYCAQLPHLLLLKDTDNDGKADSRVILLSGFDDHDTHHAISSFSADPSGAIYMCEGTFLHSNIETANGPIRSFGGGFFRFDPRTRSLEKSARLGLPNPWGVAVDDWGQNFYIVARNFQWMLPGTVKTNYGEFAPIPEPLIKKDIVRPTCGVEFISSRHFPDEVQGDVLINNTIGFRGAKQHQVEEDGTGYKLTARHDMFFSEDGNFRPTDLEFAPDGSLYVIDWHNILIGHMQHNARDPLRDNKHGRIYRITCPSRPLVTPAKIAGAPLATLFDNLKLPEYRSRYRTRRELRGREAKEVLPALQEWVANLDKADSRYKHHVLEALWVSWGAGKIDPNYLRQCLESKDHRARAAAVNVLRYSDTQIGDKNALLRMSAMDQHGRVRLETTIAASWMDKKDGLEILEIVASKPMDKILKKTYDVALAQLKGERFEGPKEKELVIPKHLRGEQRGMYRRGHQIYLQEGHCGTCHQEDGKGLPAAQFPPLDGTPWVTGSEERLIKIALHGLHGPIEVKGVKYPGLVPMTAFKQLSDQQLADVLTYVRNSFGNKASAIKPNKVKQVRAASKDVQSFLNPADLLREHPHE
ncbi:MAG: PVC-type heme-binding CxxCH protein [Akkermansiaceae bacterium]